MSSSSDPLAMLRDTRLPATSQSAFFADLALGCAIGLIVALLLLLCARFVLDRERIFRRQVLADLAASRAEDKPERLLSQVKILRRLSARHGHVPVGNWLAGLFATPSGDSPTAVTGDALSKEIFRPDPQIEPDQLDDFILGLLKRLKR